MPWQKGRNRVHTHCRSNLQGADYATQGGVAELLLRGVLLLDADDLGARVILRTQRRLGAEAAVLQHLQLILHSSFARQLVMRLAGGGHDATSSQRLRI